MLPQRRPQTRGRRPLVPPNTTSDESDDESKTKRRRHKQTTSPFQIVRVENRDVYCITDFGLKVALRAAAAKPVYGAVEGFITDDKTGTLILGRCVFGDGTPWSIILRSWRRKNSHAAAFLKGYGASALDALVMKSKRDVVLLPVIDSESRHARGVLPEWCEAIVKENPRVIVDATILSHVEKIGKPSHDKPQLRPEFHAIFGPDVDVAALAKHKGKLLIITATHFFTHGKLDGYLKVLTAGAHGFDIVFHTMVVAACGSAISHIQPVALTKPVHDRLVAASELALQSDENASTEVQTRLGHIYAAQELIVSKDRYVGSTCARDSVMETHGPSLLVALQEGKRRDVATYSKLLMQPRANTHQYQLARGDKGERFTRWFKSAVAAIKRYHFLRSMSEQCIVVSAGNDSHEGFKSALLRLEGHALYLAHEDARSGVMPTLNIATNAFFIGGEPVPDPERGGELVWQGHTKKSQRRAAATRAVRGLGGAGQRVPTCREVGADALDKAIARRAGDSATLAADALVAVARALDAAAKDLHAAPRRSDESEDAHVDFRAAECCWRAALASADASGDDAATHARALCVAAAAVDAAAKRVVADVEPEVKLAARRDLEDAEAAWKRLYVPKSAPKPRSAPKPKSRAARRPCPTSRAARHRPTTRRRRMESFPSRGDECRRMRKDTRRPGTATKASGSASPRSRRGARVPLLAPSAIVQQRVVASQAPQIAKQPAFKQCTTCEVAYTSGRFCPTCDNKLAAVDQTTFPVVGLPPASPVEEEAPVDSDDEVIWDSARARPPAEIEAEALRMDATAAAEAPAPDDSTSRVAHFLRQGRPFFAKQTADAVCVRVGTSQAFKEAVAARADYHREINFTSMRNVDGGSDSEAQAVVDMLAPDFRNLAVAELLGDAAPSASSPRDPSPDELAAMLQRFVLRGGKVNALLAKAGVAPGQS